MHAYSLTIQSEFNFNLPINNTAATTVLIDESIEENNLNNWNSITKRHASFNLWLTCVLSSLCLPSVMVSALCAGWSCTQTSLTDLSFYLSSLLVHLISLAHTTHYAQSFLPRSLFHWNLLPAHIFHAGVKLCNGLTEQWWNHAQQIADITSERKKIRRKARKCLQRHPTTRNHTMLSHKKRTHKTMWFGMFTVGMLEHRSKTWSLTEMELNNNSNKNNL